MSPTEARGRALRRGVWLLAAVVLVLAAAAYRLRGGPGLPGRAAAGAERLELEDVLPPGAEQSPGSDPAPTVAKHREGTARLGQAALRDRLPLMPGATQVAPLGETEEANGVPMALLAFEVHSQPQEILAFYALEFRRHRWPWAGVEPGRGIIPNPAISATIPDEDLQVSVMVMPHPEDDGSSTVVLGLADMRAFRDGKPTETWDLPRYPGTTPLAVRSLESGTEALTVHFTTPAPESEVRAFYRSALAAQGYSAGPPTEGAAAGPSADQGPLQFASANRRWTVSIARAGTTTSVVAEGARVDRSAAGAHP